MEHCTSPIDTSCEPMDVDLSTNSANNSYKELHSEASSQKIKSEPEVWHIKKYHIVRDKTNNMKNSTTLISVGVLCIFLSIIVYCILDIKCCDNLDLKELRIRLNNRLYGQPEVIDSLIKSLEEDVNTKILFLYGGTGVGKTLTVSITLENFWNSTNIYHYTMPSFVNSFSVDTMLGLNLCKSAIVVLDDLQQNDFNVKTYIEEMIRKSESLNKKIIVILIYNCDIITGDFVKKCDDSFYSELTRAYADITVYKSFIEFKPLTQEILKLCIQDELKGKVIDNLSFDRILSNFNATLDGCKGVYKKIKFLNVL